MLDLRYERLATGYGELEDVVVEFTSDVEVPT